MCLSSITYKNLDVQGIGYKVVSIVNKKAQLARRLNMPFGVTKKAKKTPVYSADGYYDSGFHIFLNKKDAISYGDTDDYLVQVSYKKGRILGEQGSQMPCIIADEMKLEKVIGKLSWNNEKGETFLSRCRKLAV